MMILFRSKLTFEKVKNILENINAKKIEDNLEEKINIADFFSMLKEEFFKVANYQYVCRRSTRASFLHILIENWNRESKKLDLIREVLNVNKNMVNARDENFGTTPIFRAALCKDFAVIKILCDEYKADVKTTTTSGSTLLHSLFSSTPFSVECNYAEIAKYLIEKGVNVLAKNKDGLDFFQILISNNTISKKHTLTILVELANYIFEKGKTEKNEEMQSFAQSYLKMFEPLAKIQKEIHIKAKESETPPTISRTHSAVELTRFNP